MAPYATPAQVRRALTGQAAPVDHTASELDDVTVQDAIDQAAARVDAALAGRYPLPLPSVPRLVTDLTVALAAWYATLTYYGSVDLTDRDPVSLRKAEADRLLEQISLGRADLPGMVDADGDGQPDPVPSGPPRVFNTVPALFGSADFHLTRAPAIAAPAVGERSEVDSTDPDGDMARYFSRRRG